MWEAIREIIMFLQVYRLTKRNYQGELLTSWGFEPCAGKAKNLKYRE